MSHPRLLISFLIIFSSHYCGAQSDSILQTLHNLQQVPVKYITTIDNKIDKYSTRITSKTEKTLAKLSKWENKIKGILDKVSPETSAKLFGNNQTTFSTLLQKIKEGKTVAEGYKTKYNEYRDKLTTNIKYLETQKDKIDKKLLNPINDAKKKLDELEQDISNTEAVEAFIKERKKQLVNEAVKHIGKSKYLTKIDKEAYYYVETLRNYKELFSDKKKAEEVALKILNKIPAFNTFIEENSILGSLFRSPNNSGNPPNLAGLQTRATIQELIQTRIAAGGPNAQQQVSENLQKAQAYLTQLKDKIIKAGGGNSDMEIPDFKPKNQQKTKTVFQRLELGSNFQFAKNNSLMPTVADIAMSIGYKLNDKSLAGIGASYKIGLGSIQHISISHQGIGIRSFIDWKAPFGSPKGGMLSGFYISGGFEMNHNAQFKNIAQLKNYNQWQQAGLIGLTKKLPIKTKWTKGAKLQILYDVMARKHTPVSQPILFRTGYNF